MDRSELCSEYFSCYFSNLQGIPLLRQVVIKCTFEESKNPFSNAPFCLIKFVNGYFQGNFCWAHCIFGLAWVDAFLAKRGEPAGLLACLLNGVCGKWANSEGNGGTIAFGNALFVLEHTTLGTTSCNIPFPQANQRHIIAGAMEGLVNVEYASACLSGASNEQHKLKHVQRFPVAINHSRKQTSATS